ncbi:MAG: hypothetical protein K2X39_09190 [Silvanigrellaceae bacterium]|nr:hypothetical protein [Silvanigrellaceae bacterium]
MRKTMKHTFAYSFVSGIILSTPSCLKPLSSDSYSSDSSVRSVVPSDFQNTSNQSTIASSQGNVNGVTQLLGFTNDSSLGASSYAANTMFSYDQETTTDPFILSVSKVAANLKDLMVSAKKLAVISKNDSCTNAYGGTTGFGSLVQADAQQLSTMITSFITSSDPTGWTLNATPASIPGVNSQYAYTYTHTQTGGTFSVALQGDITTGKWIFGYDTSSTIPIVSGSTTRTFTTSKGIIYADLSAKTLKYAFRIVGDQADSNGTSTFNVSPIISYTFTDSTNGNYTLDLIGGVNYNQEPYIGQGTFSTFISPNIKILTFDAVFPKLSGAITAIYSGQNCTVTENSIKSRL